MSFKSLFEQLEASPTKETLEQVLTRIEAMPFSVFTATAPAYKRNLRKPLAAGENMGNRVQVLVHRVQQLLRSAGKMAGERMPNPSPAELARANPAAVARAANLAAANAMVARIMPRRNPNAPMSSLNGAEGGRRKTRRHSKKTRKGKSRARKH